MNSIYLLIGGNIGDRVTNLNQAKDLIEKRLGKIKDSSSIYETASWGITEQPDFLNQVLFLETNFSAQQSMQIILSIENEMGRQRSQKNASRIIDIDILFFNDEIINEPHLTIPHPEIQNRKFTLIPLMEIAPQLVHPVLKKSISELLLASDDTLPVKIFKEN